MMKKLLGIFKTPQKTDQKKETIPSLYVNWWNLESFIKQLNNQGFSNKLIDRCRTDDITVEEFSNYLSSTTNTSDLQPWQIYKYAFAEGFAKIIASMPHENAKQDFYRYCSINRSGYARELGFKHLVEHLHPEKLPFILIRLNDYVAEIRNQAFNTLSKLLKAEYNAALLDNFSLIHNLQNQKHPQAQKAYQQILDFLLQDSSTRLHIPNVNNRARLLIAKTFIKANYDKQYLAEWLLHDPLFVIRQKVLPFYDELPRDKFLSLLNDPSFAIRKAMLYWLDEHGTPEEKNKHYQEKLLDHSRTVRQLAQFYLKQTNTDLVSFYQEAFQNGNIEQSLLGLVDLSNDSLMNQAIPYLENPITQQQIAAFLYLSHCKDYDLYRWTLDHLADDYSRLQKYLLDYLADYMNDEVEHKLTTLLSESSLDVTQRRVLRLLARFRSVNTFKICLQFTVDSREPVKSLAKQLVVKRLKALKYGTYLNQEHMDETLKIIAIFLQQFESSLMDESFSDFLKSI